VAVDEPTSGESEPDTLRTAERDSPKEALRLPSDGVGDKDTVGASRLFVLVREMSSIVLVTRRDKLLVAVIGSGSVPVGLTMALAVCVLVTGGGCVEVRVRLVPVRVSVSGTTTVAERVRLVPVRVSVSGTTCVAVRDRLVHVCVAVTTGGMVRLKDPERRVSVIVTPLRDNDGVPLDGDAESPEAVTVHEALAPDAVLEAEEDPRDVDKVSADSVSDWVALPVYSDKELLQDWDLVPGLRDTADTVNESENDTETVKLLDRDRAACAVQASSAAIVTATVNRGTADEVMVQRLKVIIGRS
jgi:hypothetical protein